MDSQRPPHLSFGHGLHQRRRVLRLLGDGRVPERFLACSVLASWCYGHHDDRNIGPSKLGYLSFRKDMERFRPHDLKYAPSASAFYLGIGAKSLILD